MTDRRNRDDTIRAVDLFCGAGGLSYGLALACETLDREVELVAVNHWAKAIETHERNHPWARHHHAKVEELDPRSVFDTERVEILVAGPQCTHFSTARGGRPVNEQLRASPWHVLDWLQKLYAETFVIENVPEFESWGPVGADGKPLKSKRGETFEAWINALHSLGYSVDWRVLNAADYGDATSRRRLFIIGRRSSKGRPEWPAPTHTENGERPGTDPWRPAAEIIDWSDPGESIWTRDRPLVNNTMKRIAEGLRRYGHEDLEPFADAIAELDKADVENMQADPVPVDEVGEVVEHRCEPFLVRFSHGGATLDADSPVPTITTARGGVFALAIPYLLGQQSGGRPQSVEEDPCPTIATGGAISKIEPRPFVLPRNGYHRGLDSNPPYDPEERPLHTVTAKNHDGHVVRPYLVPFYGEREDQDPRTHDVDDPLPTVPASKVPAGVCSPYLVQYNGNSDANGVDEPLATVTTRERFALCLPECYPWGLDVRFRMLKPSELAAAMGFPQNYDFAGNKTETIEQIGNAVPVNLARALCHRLLSSSDPTLTTFTSNPAAVETDGGRDE